MIVKIPDERILIINTNLDASRAPVNELDRPLRLDRRDRSVHVLAHDVAPVAHAAGHVLAVAGVALHHLVGGLEAGVGDLRHGELLVVSLLRRDDGGVHSQGEMDPERRKMKLEVLIKKLI